MTIDGIHKIRNVLIYLEDVRGVLPRGKPCCFPKELSLAEQQGLMLAHGLLLELLPSSAFMRYISDRQDASRT